MNETGSRAVDIAANLGVKKSTVSLTLNRPIRSCRVSTIEAYAKAAGGKKVEIKIS